jgi:anti-anti-sigma factor
MLCETCQKGDTVVCTVKGRLDSLTAPDLEKECTAWMEAGTRLLVFDLSELEYISSAGLRVFIATAKKLKARQGELRFCNAHAIVKEVFVIAGLPSMFTLYDSLDAALGAAS